MVWNFKDFEIEIEKTFLTDTSQIMSGDKVILLEKVKWERDPAHAWEKDEIAIVSSTTTNTIKIYNANHPLGTIFASKSHRDFMLKITWPIEKLRKL